MLRLGVVMAATLTIHNLPVGMAVSFLIGKRLFTRFSSSDIMNLAAQSNKLIYATTCFASVNPL